MAGGEGTRLRPLTSNQPKPMLPMANIPMMEHVVNLLRQHGFEDIVVTVAFMANAIRTYFGDGSEFGVRMVYATESTPLGTAGSVRNARDELDERFLVISGDVLTDIDLTQVVDFHDQRGGLATLALKAVDNPLEFGIVITDEDGSIERFLEKPTWGQVFSDTINTGIYVLEPEIFDFIPEGQAGRLLGRVVPRGPGRREVAVRLRGRRLLGGRGHPRGLPPVPSGHPRPEGPGRHQGLRAASPGVAGQGGRDRPERGHRRPGGHRRQLRRSGPGPGWASTAPWVATSASATTPCSSARWSTTTPTSARACASTAACSGRGSDLRQGVRCEEGVVLGDQCFVGAHAEIKAGVKVYPFKTVEAGATVNSSIVWESMGARSLFGREGVQGLANVDISPELAVRLSMAWASTFEKGARRSPPRGTPAGPPGCSSGPSWSAATRRGSTSTTSRRPPCPVTRFQVTSSDSMAGVTVRLAPDDPQSVVLRFFDKEGIDVDETTQRKIERLYHREDFRRVLAREIGDIDFPPRSLEHYTAALIDSVDLSNARQADLKLVLDYSFGTSSFVMPNLLAKLEAEVLVVNPYANTAGVLTFDRQASAARVSELVRASGAHLGAVLDPGGEHVAIVDDLGHPLTDDEALLVLLTLVTEAHPSARVALPVAASVVAEEICQKAGAEIVWTKLSASHLMEVARTERVTLAASQSGGLHLPRPSCPPTTPPPPWSTCWPCSPPRGGSSPSWWPSSPPCTSPTRRCTPPGTRRGWSCAPWWSGPGRPGAGPGRRGQGHRGRRVGPRAARSRGAPDPRVGRGRQRRPGRGAGQRVRRAARAAAALSTGRPNEVM